MIKVLNRVVMKKVSLSDLAHHLGVSKTLVSLVLNGKGDQYGINKDVQKKVKEKAIELNYRPNQTARNLRSGKTNTIGLVVDDLSDSYQSRLFKYLEDEASKNGYSLIVTTTKEKKGDSIATLMGKSVDGIIFNSNLSDKGLGSLLKNDFPVVSMRKSGNNLNSNFVGIDYEKTVYSDIKYLIEKGHHDIAIAFENKNSDILMSEILKGAKKAYKNTGVNPAGLLALSIDAKDGNEVSNVLKELRANNPKLSAIVSVNDVLTLKLVESIHEMGIKIPEQFSVVSLFDNDVFTFTFPKITANQTPYKELAEYTLNLLMNQIGGKQKLKEEVRLVSNFIERASA